MKLFHWWSIALRNYGRGQIVVMAETAEEARDKARAQYMDWLREEKSFCFLDDGSVDPDEKDSIDYLFHLFEIDIAAEPKAERSVFFIRGSE